MILVLSIDIALKKLRNPLYENGYLKALIKHTYTGFSILNTKQVIQK